MLLHVVVHSAIVQNVVDGLPNGMDPVMKTLDGDGFPIGLEECVVKVLGMPGLETHPGPMLVCWVLGLWPCAKELLPLGLAHLRLTKKMPWSRF